MSSKPPLRAKSTHRARKEAKRYLRLHLRTETLGLLRFRPDPVGLASPQLEAAFRPLNGDLRRTRDYRSFPFENNRNCTDSGRILRHGSSAAVSAPCFDQFERSGNCPPTPNHQSGSLHTRLISLAIRFSRSCKNESLATAHLVRGETVF